MFAAIFSVAALAFAGLVAAEDITINTPQAVHQCQEVVITWKGGKGPYNVSVVPGDDPCDEALVEFPVTNDTWYHWQNPGLKPGTKIIFAAEDATGDEAWSAELTVQAGSTSTCNSTIPGAPSPSGTTLAVPASQYTTGSSSDPSDGPVANAGGSLGAAPSAKNGLMTAVGAGLVAAVSVAFAL